MMNNLRRLHAVYSNLKFKVVETLKDEKGDVMTTVLIAACLILGILAFNPTIITWITTIGTYIINFFQTKIQGFLK